MAKYIVETSNRKKYEKSFGMPMWNLIPGIVWSIPLYQKLAPHIGGGFAFGISVAFVILYLVLSYYPFGVFVPAIPSVIMDTALFWALADFIPNKVVEIIVKIVIALFFVMLQLSIVANAMIPWMESKEKPNIRVIPD